MCPCCAFKLGLQMLIWEGDPLKVFMWVLYWYVLWAVPV